MMTKLKNNKTLLGIVFLGLVALFLPITLLLLRDARNLSSRAALPSNLEAEAGVLSSTGVSKQNDSNASGSQFVLFNKRVPTNTPAPTTPPSTSGQIYGPGIAIDSKYNIRIGDIGNKIVSVRFRASTSSRAESVTWEKRYGDGYSKGDGGRIKVSIQTDDGSTNHYPSGQILDSVTFNPGSSGGGNSKNLFPNKPLLTEGQIYHVVWENLHSDLENNYMSINHVWTQNDSISGGGQPNRDFSGMYRVIVQRNGDWGYKPETYDRFTAVMDLAYADGTHEGQAYMQAFYESGSADTEIIARIEGQRQAREIFTVQDGDKKVTAATIRAGKEYGSSPLTISLKNSSGVTLGSGTVPASAVGYFADYISSRETSHDNGDWVTVDFNSPITLSNGSTYQLVMNSPSGTRYNMTAIRYRGRNDYELESWAFREGRAQLSRDGGANWENNYNWQPYSNYQFYLTLQ